MLKEKAVHLLYITNDVKAASSLRQGLRQVGYLVEVVGVDEAGQNLAALQPEVYDVIMADYQMGSNDAGVSIIHDLMVAPSSPPLIVFIKSGHEQRVLEAVAMGAHDYVIKDEAGNYLQLVLLVIEQVFQQEQLRTEKQHALEMLDQHKRDLTLLTWVAEELTVMFDSQQVIERLLQGVTETIGAVGASVWLLESEPEEALVCQAVFHHGFKRKLVNLKVPSGRGVVGWVAQNKQSAIVPSAADDPRFSPEIDSQIGFTTKDILAVPLCVRDEVIGVLEVVNKEEGSFEAQDCALIETLAASAAITIDNARLIEALRSKTSELERQNEALGAFARTVAHDLKNPLTLIAGTAQVLETEHKDLPDETLEHHLGAIVRNSRRANRLIEELLLLAELSDAEVYVEPLDMRAILDEVQKRLAYMIQAHRAEINIPEDWPVALGYAPWIEQVWVNYISNALKYGGTPPQVELGATPQEDGIIRFWVRDNGPGLTPEEQSQVFEPFTRLNRTRATGHGLGLSIVQRIMEKLGGEVGVESEGIAGQGSVFSFILPRA